MKRITLAATLLACLLMSTVALAHGGHRHDAKGTIAAIDEARLTLADTEGTEHLFTITEATAFMRGTEASSREDVVVGERSVVIYEKKDGRNVAIEVKLGPKME